MQKIFKDKWFYYKLFSFIISLFFLLYIYIYQMVEQDWLISTKKIENYPFYYHLYQSFFTSYFTIQSNILVMVWFFLAFIYHNNEDKIFWTGQKSKILMSTYISVTFFIYFTALLPLAAAEMGAFKWITGLGQHLLVPILMVFYTLCNIGKQKYEYKKYSIKVLPYNLIYPILYLFITLIRAEFLRKDNVPNAISYPYFFLNFHQSSLGMPGPVVLILFTIIITSSFIGFNYIYLYLNNLRYKQINWMEINKN